ncbi:protein G12-like isoform X2 [Anopheles stephensi]|uniref:protein G12-like isoform X2 n=1 Tax=Anopheles stephensi TaxID=30069 RepID=UPI001658AA95|nr:protein G12-like isoform X2 [Anopheles stephensi]
MMKLSFLALMVVSVSESGLAVHSNSLPRDIEDFVDLLDLAQITRLTNAYYVNDKDFQSMLEYLQSIEFSAVWHGFFSLAMMRDVGLYLSREGVPFYDYVDLVANFIGQTPLIGRMISRPQKPKYRGLKAYVEELFAMLPWQEWHRLYDVKQANSAPFKALVSELHRINYIELKQFYEQGAKIVCASSQKLWIGRRKLCTIFEEIFLHCENCREI